MEPSLSLNNLVFSSYGLQHHLALLTFLIVLLYCYHFVCYQYPELVHAVHGSFYSFFVNNIILSMDLSWKPHLSKTRINNLVPKAVAIFTSLSSIISDASNTRSSKTEITSANNPRKTISISFIRCGLKHYYRSTYICKPTSGCRLTYTVLFSFSSSYIHY
jgi:hypothetical protein